MSNPARNREYSLQSSRRSSVKKRILLVDDDSFVLRAMRRQLSTRHHVDTAANVEEAARNLASKTYDAIVTDYDMPAYNGIWLLGQVAMQHPNMKRIMISGRERFIMEPHIKSGLIQHFHSKPVIIDDMLKALSD